MEGGEKFQLLYIINELLFLRETENHRHTMSRSSNYYECVHQMAASYGNVRHVQCEMMSNVVEKKKIFK